MGLNTKGLALYNNEGLQSDGGGFFNSEPHIPDPVSAGAEAQHVTSDRNQRSANE
jgi:hypothetical protein